MQEVDVEVLLKNIDHMISGGWATQPEIESGIVIRKLIKENEELRAKLAEIEPLTEQIAKLKSKKIAKETTPGFDAFWNAWPAGPRKVNKRNCLTRWVRAGLECRHGEIVAHVEACKLSRDWVKDGGAYIPAPLVYLNQERFLAPAPAPAAAPRAVGSISNIKYTTEGIGDDGHFS